LNILLGDPGLGVGASFQTAHILFWKWVCAAKYC